MCIRGQAEGGPLAHFPGKHWEAVSIRTLVPGLRRSPGEGKGYPLQYSALEKSMDCTVHGVTKSQAQLNDFHI